MTKNDAVSSSVVQVNSDFWFTLYYLADEIKDDGMDERCNSHGKLENCVQYFRFHSKKSRK